MLFRKRAPVAASPVEDLAKPLSFETLFDPGFLAGLKAFSLRIARAQKGGRLAEQRTNARGQGAELAGRGVGKLVWPVAGRSPSRSMIIT